MGERLNGIQEVRGSIPRGSTKENTDLVENEPRLVWGFFMPGNVWGHR